jgi:hypothetical protein
MQSYFEAGIVDLRAKTWRAKMTKPRIKITADQIEELARAGLSVAQIAGSLRVSETTLRNRLRDKKAFQLALEKGRADSVEKVSNKLFESAMSGNVTAQIFFLKCRAGWKETDKHELTGADGKELQTAPFVIINDLKE